VGQDVLSKDHPWLVSLVQSTAEKMNVRDVKLANSKANLSLEMNALHLRRSPEVTAAFRAMTSMNTCWVTTQPVVWARPMEARGASGAKTTPSSMLVMARARHITRAKKTTTIASRMVRVELAAGAPINAVGQCMMKPRPCIGG